MKRLFVLVFILLMFSGIENSYAGIIESDAIGVLSEDDGGKYIQEWQEPFEKADLLLFSTHADDEHLFFAGILPYCTANDIKAQVVYMTNHDDNPVRNAERLDGLWDVGVRNYPVVSDFPDLYAESLSEAVNIYGKKNVSEDDFVAFCVSNIRRFKPQVVVGHDVNGEYGHGGHMLSAASLMNAVELAGDYTYHGESVMEYGIWDVPKAYIHLWNERKIDIDIDEPLEFFDGKTAFQVSQYGYSFHKSQQWTYFTKWLTGTAESPVTASTQIKSYPPGKFGLFRTTVGEDSESAVDFFENVALLKDIPDIVPDPPELSAITDDSEASEPLNTPIVDDEDGQDSEFQDIAEKSENVDKNAEKPLPMWIVLGIVLVGAGILLATAFIIYKVIRK